MDKVPRIRAFTSNFILFLHYDNNVDMFLTMREHEVNFKHRLEAFIIMLYRT